MWAGWQEKQLQCLPQAAVPWKEKDSYKESPMQPAKELAEAGTVPSQLRVTGSAGQYTVGSEVDILTS